MKERSRRPAAPKTEVPDPNNRNWPPAMMSTSKIFPMAMTEGRRGGGSREGGRGKRSIRSSMKREYPYSSIVLARFFDAVPPTECFSFSSLTKAFL